jgi:hypothetical protein
VEVISWPFWHKLCNMNDTLGITVTDAHFRFLGCPRYDDPTFLYPRHMLQ